MSDVLQEQGAATAVPDILEIRVHGVQNTPPAEMLETTPENVTRDRGDDLGSFWRRKDDAPAHGIQRIEAFSWGAQARTGGGAIAAIGRVFVHLGWFLLLPFALANLAYWTREIKPQQKANDQYWDGDTGAATVRIFALMLTLLAVVAFSSVAIDLVAVQCFRRPTEETPSGEVCAALPAALDGFRDLGRDSRAALFGLIPIAVILLLYVIGRRGRVHFEERIRKFAAGLQDYENEPGVPLLATGGFWSQSRIGRTSEWLHVAASVALVTFLLALDAAYMNDPERCWREVPEQDPIGTAQECLAYAGTQPIPFWFGIGALALLVVIVILVWRASHTRDGARTEAKRGLAMACLSISIAGYAAWTILTFTPLMPAPADEAEFLGLIIAPIFLVAVAFLLAVAGAGWKAREPKKNGGRSPDAWRRPVSAALIVLAGIALAGSHFVTPDELRWVLVGGAVLLLLLHLVVAWTVPRSHLHQAWRGQGAAVAMLLALFASMALSSLLVLGTAFWLNTPAEAGTVSEIWREPAVVGPSSSLNVPDAYERFAVLLTAIALLMVVLVLLAMGWNLVRLVIFTLPKLRRPAADESDLTMLAGIEEPCLGAYPGKLVDTDPRKRRRVTVRRSSHLLHRGEPLFGWLAVLAAIGFLSLSSTVVFETARDSVASVSNALPSAIRLASNAVLAFVALAVIAAVATHAAASSERPLGVFWDVVAFFPRAGHPFAPPCFGERVVPELSARTRAWLEIDTGPSPRAVLFTAHSMGSTICTATILSQRGETIERGPSSGHAITDRVAMLSYGTQLRAYFSRFFPSVFGPGILGVPGTRGPSLWHRDPWRKQVEDEWSKDLPAPATDREKTLTGLLGSDGTDVRRWRSLWRRTDYLGFPVYAYRGAGNPIDLGATESAPASYLWRIATHSDYLGTPQYEEARDILVHGIRAESTAPR